MSSHKVREASWIVVTELSLDCRRRGHHTRLPAQSKTCWPKGQHACRNSQSMRSGDLPTTPSCQAEKPTASQHQTRQSCTDDGAGDRDVDIARAAVGTPGMSGRAEDAGSEQLRGYSATTLRDF